MPLKIVKFPKTKQKMSQVIHDIFKETLPVMHDYIRDLTDMERLGMFLYARDVFPNKTPIMDGSGFPQESRAAILAKIDEGKKFMSDQARNGPLKMLLMVPDPHGTGGTR